MNALVVGGSNDVWQEVDTAQKLAAYSTTYCVNEIGSYWDRGSFVWCSLHPEHLSGWIALRRKLDMLDNFSTVGPLETELGQRHRAHNVDRRVSFKWKNMTASGSSGLFAVKVALDDGHDRVVCAGVPMVSEATHFMRHQLWPQATQFIHGWEQAMPHLMGKVRSLSGWTRERLGEPTAEWLASEHVAA